MVVMISRHYDSLELYTVQFDDKDTFCLPRQQGQGVD